MKDNKSVLLDFFRFIVSPKYDVEQVQKKTVSKLWDIFRLWAVFFIVSMILGYLSVRLMQVCGFDADQHKIVELFAEKKIWFIIIFGVIWAPISEELSFRMFLKYSPYKLSFALSFILITIFQVICLLWTKVNEIFPEWLFTPNVWQGLLTYVGFIVVVGLVLGFLFDKKLNKEKVDRFFADKFCVIFYLSAFVFAVLHFFNYENFQEIWFLSLLIVAPQFILALCLGYVRMAYGLRWSIFTHFIHNSLTVIPALTLTFVSPDVFEQLQSQTIDPANLGFRDSLIIGIGGWLMLLIAVFVIIAAVNLLLELYKVKKIGKNKNEEIN